MTSEGEDALVVYVVYKDPKDFPDKYVVRSQRAVTGAVLVSPDPLYVGDSLEKARASIPPGFISTRPQSS